MSADAHAPGDADGAAHAADGRVFEPLDPAFVRDPYPVYRWLREHDPVHRSPLGHWVLTRYDDVVAAMRDERLSNRPSRYAVVHERNAGRYVAAQVANRIVPFLDRPEHTAPRRLIARAFHDQLAARAPDVRDLAERLLAPLRARGALEVLADFATPLSVAVIGDLLGCPPADHARLKQWSSWFFYLFAPIPSPAVLDGLNAALAEFRAYMAELVEARRRAPRDDLISRLVHVRDGEHRLAPDELTGACMLLFADGVENVDSAIANAVLAIVGRPELAARLRAEPGSIPVAADEALRFDAPGQFIAKVAKQEFELRGRTIREHDAVLLVLGAANRDPAVFAEPDRFRLDRDGGLHLAFGKGRHACIGAPLVRLEMVGALTALLAGCRDLALVDAEPRWQARLAHRWLERLPLTFRAV